MRKKNEIIELLCIFLVDIEKKKYPTILTNLFELYKKEKCYFNLNFDNRTCDFFALILTNKVYAIKLNVLSEYLEIQNPMLDLILKDMVNYISEADISFDLKYDLFIFNFNGTKYLYLIFIPIFIYFVIKYENNKNVRYFLKKSYDIYTKFFLREIEKSTDDFDIIKCQYCQFKINFMKIFKSQTLLLNEAKLISADEICIFDTRKYVIYFSLYWKCIEIILLYGKIFLNLNDICDINPQIFDINFIKKIKVIKRKNFCYIKFSWLWKFLKTKIENDAIYLLKKFKKFYQKFKNNEKFCWSFPIDFVNSKCFYFIRQTKMSVLKKIKLE